MEGESKLHLRIPHALRKMLEVEAKARDRSLNGYVIHIIKGRKAGKSHPDALAKSGEKVVR